MSKFHSIVSRRDFMKGLGLAGAGLGAAAAAAPVFHDLDELIASPMSARKRNWWVKEVDKPTVEIDWNLVKRYDGYSTQSSAVVARYTGLAEYNAMTRPSTTDRMKANEPGFRLRDIALSSAGGTWEGPMGFGFGGWRVTGGPLVSQKAYLGFQRVSTPQELGVPKWTGTPEEATRMLRAAMVYLGAADIAASPLDEKHKKLIHVRGDNVSTAYLPPNWPPPTLVTKPMVFEDVPVGYVDEKTGKFVLPSKKPLWSIVLAMPQDQDLIRNAPTGNIGAPRYRLVAQTMPCTLEFLRGLGYQGYSDENYRASPAQAGAVIGGLAEASRHSNMVISPEYSNWCGYFDMFTDLPLEETKPIDAGMWRFCHTCGICADFCPSGAISKESEPTWEPTPSKITPKLPPLPGSSLVPEYHNPGTKRFWTDMVSSQVYLRSVDSCLRCWGVCVFNNKSGSMIHDVVRGTLATTPLFNGFLRDAAGWFGYGLKEGEAKDEWWDMSLPAYGFSTITLARNGGYR